MHKWTELLNKLNQSDENADWDLASLLYSINTKANTLQNAGFYTLWKDKMKIFK